jgi:hypothetical protein
LIGEHSHSADNAFRQVRNRIESERVARRRAQRKRLKVSGRWAFNRE